jgi:hypothetical protein
MIWQWLAQIALPRRESMAKGQKRSNREVKKPKANKKVAATLPAGSVGDTMAKAKPGAAVPKKG